MSFKETLATKIPTDFQTTPEYKLLLNLLKKENIKSAEELRHYLSAEIQKNKECLGTCNEAGSTSNRKRVKEAHTLEFLLLIKNKILKYVL